MAIDKAVDSAKLDAALNATAKAIQAKTGGTSKIPWNASTGFASAVEQIETGGGAEIICGGVYFDTETTIHYTDAEGYKTQKCYMASIEVVKDSLVFIKDAYDSDGDGLWMYSAELISIHENGNYSDCVVRVKEIGFEIGG